MTTAGTQFPTNQRLVTDSDNVQLDAILDHLVRAVQLTQTQHEDARQKYGAVGRWLSAENSDVRAFDPQIFPQGSLLIDTTVRPWARSEFDLDLVCLLLVAMGMPTPEQAYELLWSRMSEHETYRGIIEPCPRCIRINYAGDFHLDIVPAIPDPAGGGTALLIPDRERRVWLPSNPKGYAAWFEEMARLPLEKKHTLGATIEPLRAPEPAAVKPPLKLAVQLFKRWRDVAFSVRKEAPPPSIVLTTIAGHVYRKESHVTDALRAILTATLAWSYRDLSALTNPANPREPICERWLAAPGAYEAFRDELAAFAEAWRTLVQYGTFPVLGTELMRLFGEEPVKLALKAYDGAIAKAREEGSLRAVAKTGTLVTGGATPGLRVPAHTFFGGPRGK